MQFVKECSLEECHQPASEGGMLSPHWEDSVRAFQEMIANAIKHESTNN